MKALRKQTEAGEATYSDQDLLLYSRLSQQEELMEGMIDCELLVFPSRRAARRQFQATR